MKAVAVAAPGYGNGVAYTSDGTNWTESTISNFQAEGNGTYLATKGGLWVLVGGTTTGTAAAAALYSENAGATWTAGTIPAVGTFYFPMAVACNGDGSVWIAVGTSGTIWRSTNRARTWSLVGTGYSKSSTDNLTAICWTGQRFVAVGTSCSRAYSNADGTSWTTSHYSASSSFSGAAANGSGTVVIGYTASSTVQVSTDHGLTWSIASVATSAIVQNVIWAGGKFAALVMTSSGSPSNYVPIDTSPYGTSSWSAGASLPAGTVTTKGPIAWIGDGYMVAGSASSNTLWRSNSSISSWSAAKNLSFQTGAIAAEVNTAPNAPTLTSPASNTAIDRGITQRFAWNVSDPDAGDSQSKFDLQYRLTGGTWTTVTGTTPNTYWDAAAGTFAAGNYEWQARTYDSQGVVGPWSASSFFTAADAPAPATITAPTSGATVGNTATLTWSAPNQTDYQWRRVKDNAGSADTGTIYADSGDVVSATTRSVMVTFDTNNRWEHLQVRVKYNGLWSAWSDVRIQVSYTPPPTPTFTLTPDNTAGSPTQGSILVAITNPAPGTGQPAVSYNDVYVTDPGKSEERRATNVATNGTWRYWTPPHGFDGTTIGHVRVTAVATNGTTAST